MSKREQCSALIGVMLLGLAAFFLFGEKPLASASHSGQDDKPIDKLAEDLKEAWGEHHTTA